MMQMGLGHGLAKAAYPLREETLDAAWKQNMSQGLTGKDSFKKFQVFSESIARPDSEHDLFPKTVLHESWCGEQCRQFGDHSRINMHVNTLNLLNFIVDQTLAWPAWMFLLLSSYKAA